LTNLDAQVPTGDDLPLTIAFLIALAATLGALFIGEVLGQMPCTLCWYQRIAMFPLVPILGLSLWRGDGMARAYALPLVLAGLALAAWHSGLYAGFLPEPIVPCTENGPSCSGPAHYNPGGATSKEKYDWIATHLSNAVEEAIEIRNKN
jgi:disulfide bond formation protein DsbB